GYAVASLLCVLPCLLFLVQYLWVDLRTLEDLAQHASQQLLISDHFGYRVASQLFPLDSLHLSSGTLMERLALLVDYASAGPFLSLTAACLLLGNWRLLAARRSTSLAPVKKRTDMLLWSVLLPLSLLFLLVLLGRAPAAMVFEYAAKSALA